MNGSLPGSSVHGILQARILEWVAVPSSRGSSWLRDGAWISCGSCITGRFFTIEPPGKPIHTSAYSKCSYSVHFIFCYLELSTAGIDPHSMGIATEGRDPGFRNTLVCFCCLVTKSRPTLCDPMDCSLQGSSVHGISQARILEWVAICFSRGSSWPFLIFQELNLHLLLWQTDSLLLSHQEAHTLI